MQIARRDEVAALLSRTQAALEKAAAEYTGALLVAQEFCRGVADEMEDYHGEKSDKWRESEAGERYEEWMTAWQEIEFPEYVDLEEQAAEKLLELDTEAQS